MGAVSAVFTKSTCQVCGSESTSCFECKLLYFLWLWKYSVLSVEILRKFTENNKEENSKTRKKETNILLPLFRGNSDVLIFWVWGLRSGCLHPMTELESWVQVPGPFLIQLPAKAGAGRPQVMAWVFGALPAIWKSAWSAWPSTGCRGHPVDVIRWSFPPLSYSAFQVNKNEFKRTEGIHKWHRLEVVIGSLAIWRMFEIFPNQCFLLMEEAGETGTYLFWVRSALSLGSFVLSLQVYLCTLR